MNVNYHTYKSFIRRFLFFIALMASANFAIGQSSDQLEKMHQEMDQKFAEEKYEQVISMEQSIFNAMGGRADSIALDIYYFVSESHRLTGNTSAAIKLAEQEKEVREQIKNGEMDPNYVYLLDNLGTMYIEIGNLDKGIQYLESGNKGIIKIMGERSEDALISTIGLAKSYGMVGRAAEGIKLLTALISKNFVIENPGFHVAVLKNLGGFYLENGNMIKAEESFLKLLELSEKEFGPQSIEYIEAIFFTARLHFERANYGHAELLFSNAIETIESIGSFQEYILPLNTYLAYLYLRIGLYDDGIENLNKIESKVSKLSLYEQIDFYTLKGNLYMGMMENSLSEENHLKALKLLDNTEGKNSFVYANIQNNRSKNFQQTRQLSKSIELSEESYNIYAKSFKNHPRLLFYQHNLAMAYYLSNNLKKAKPLLEKSYTDRKEKLGSSHPEVTETTKKLADFYWYTKSYDKADKLYEEAITGYFDQIENYFPGLSEQEKVNFYTNKIRVAFESFNSYALERAPKNPEYLGKVYDNQLATKALIMYATNKVRDNILKSGEEELIKKYTDWISSKEMISQLYAMSVEERKEQPFKIDSLIKSANDLEKELSRISADFAESYIQKNLTWKDVQAKLKDNEAAVEIIRMRAYSPDSAGRFTDDIKYVALIVKKGMSNPQLVLIENGREIEERYIKNYRNAIKYKVADRYSYDVFWKPINDKLGDVNTIYVSPDGVYNQISLNSLQNPASKKFLVEEKNIRLITNTKDLISYSRPADGSMLNSGKAHLFGFPNYDKGLTADVESLESMASKVASNVSLDRGLRGSLQRFVSANSLMVLLPGTKVEVEMIDKMITGNSEAETVTLLGDDAVETAIKQVDSPMILHIATHGFFMEDTEADEDAFKYAQNPLLKSGLIMAGANNYITRGFSDSGNEDGILTAYEAMNLNLSNTELVVLSACETGLGDVKNGEGVYGLQRAFLVAGAKTLIMSMWSVDDQATQELMTLFYEEWLKTGDKQASFQKAQLSLKEKYKSPFYWGAFVMVGQ